MLRHYVAVLIVLGLLLALPSLRGGLLFDDFIIRATVLDCHPIEGPGPNPWLPFSFLAEDRGRRHALIDRGLLPWWTDPECRIAFLRPVTTLTHVADHRLWGGWPWLMHVQSLAWFALLIWAVAVLYRRMMAPTLAAWVAALAALLFTIDDAHAMPVVWVANRNTLIAAFFGVLALIAHDRWRRDGWRPGAVLAPLALLVALLSKEAAVCAGAYLLGYALFIEQGRRPWRLASLLPCFLVGVVWYVVYRAMGFGLSGSGVYVDPGSNPAEFAYQVAVRAPLLLLGQWGYPGSDLAGSLSAEVFGFLWLWAVVFLVLVGVLLWPLLARSRIARFWATGMILSLIPACVAFPSDRLLMFAGLGGMGLLAEFLGGWKEGASWVPRRSAWKWLARVFVCFFVVIHLVIAPLGFLFLGNLLRLVRNGFNDVVSTIPADPELEDQTAIFVNSACLLTDIALLYTLDYADRPVPGRVLSLSSSCKSVTVTRRDAGTIVVRPSGGYLPPPGFSPDDDRLPAVSPVYSLQYLDLLVRRADRPMALGETIELTVVTLEVTDLTEDNRPAEITFRFRVPLEDPSLRWFQLTRDGYVPFTPPAIGETVEVPRAF